MAAINIITSVHSGVIVLVAVLVTGTEGGRCLQHATNLVADDFNLVVNPFSKIYQYQFYNHSSSVYNYFFPTVFVDSDHALVEFWNGSSFGLNISPYRLLFSEVSGISGTVSLGISNRSAQAERLISCGFTNVSFFDFIVVVNFEDIAITQVSVHVLMLSFK